MNKKILFGILTAFLLLSACSSGEDEAEEPKSSPNEKAKESNNGVDPSSDEKKNDPASEEKALGDSKKIEPQYEKEALNEVIDDAKIVTKEDYTDSSYVEYQKAIDAAKKVQTNKEATPAEVTDAVASVKEAEKKLEIREGGIVKIVSESVGGLNAISGTGKVKDELTFDKVVVKNGETSFSTKLSENTFTLERKLVPEIPATVTIEVYNGDQIVESKEVNVTSK